MADATVETARLSSPFKPLQWDHLGGSIWRAEAPLFGSLRIEGSQNSGYQVLWSVPGYCASFVPGPFADMPAARRAAEEAYADRMAATLIQADLLALATRFQVSDRITVERRGENSWAVCRDGFVLADDGLWEMEPMPSSRDDDFLARCRFPLGDAMDCARRAALSACPQAV